MVYNITGQKANPNIPIPLPDMRDQPPGTHIPPSAEAAPPAHKPVEITPVSDGSLESNKETGKAEEGGQGLSAQPEKSEDKDWKELNKHSIGHILESGGDSTAGETAADEEFASQKAAAKKIKKDSARKADPSVVQLPPAAAPMPAMQTANSGGAQFQGPGFQPPQQAYAGHPPPPNNYSNFTPNGGGGHHGQQQQPPQPNLYYPPPQPYHPPYTTGYETGGPASYPTFQTNAPGGHPYPPYPSALGLPKTNWSALSCPDSIAQCPLYCCHVRAMQELEEGATDWARPYGPPASGFGDPCLCCINT